MNTITKNALERVRTAISQKEPSILRKHDLSKFFILYLRPRIKYGLIPNDAISSTERRVARKLSLTLSVLLNAQSQTLQEWFCVPKATWQESGIKQNTRYRYITKLEQLCIIKTAHGGTYQISPRGILRGLEIIFEDEKRLLWREQNMRH